MSQDPGFCTNCYEEKMRAKHQQPRMSWENATASASQNPIKKLKGFKDAVYPYEESEESHCANINCSDGRNNILDGIDDVNEGLDHASRSGGWTKVKKEDLERLEQLIEKSNEIWDAAEIDWLDDSDVRGKRWKIRDKIDKLEDNRNKSIDRTAEVASNPDRKEQGTERIKEYDDILDNLDELRKNINIQEIVSDHIHRVADRSNEQEVVVEEETATRENEEDEQQERNDANQERDDLSKEDLRARIEKLEAENEELEEENKEIKAENEDLKEDNKKLKAENEELTDDKMELINEQQDLLHEIHDITDDKRELIDEKQELGRENLDLKEKVQNLRTKVRQLENERGSEANVEATPERDGDRTVKGAVNAMATGGEGDPSMVGDHAPTNGSIPAREQSGDRESHHNPNDGAQPDASQSSSGVPAWIEDPSIKPGPDPEFYEQAYGDSPPEHLLRDDTDRTHENDAPDRGAERTENASNRGWDNNSTPGGR